MGAAACWCTQLAPPVALLGGALEGAARGVRCGARLLLGDGGRRRPGAVRALYVHRWLRSGVSWLAVRGDREKRGERGSLPSVASFCESSEGAESSQMYVRAIVDKHPSERDEGKAGGRAQLLHNLTRRAQESRARRSDSQRLPPRLWAQRFAPPAAGGTPAHQSGRLRSGVAWQTIRGRSQLSARARGAARDARPSRPLHFQAPPPLVCPQPAHLPWLIILAPLYKQGGCLNMLIAHAGGRAALTSRGAAQQGGGPQRQRVVANAHRSCKHAHRPLATRLGDTRGTWTRAWVGQRGAAFLRM